MFGGYISNILFLSTTRTSSYKSTDIEWEKDDSTLTKQLKKSVNSISGTAARQLVKFVSGSKRVVVDDDGNAIVTEDAAPLEIEETVVEVNEVEGNASIFPIYLFLFSFTC